MLDRVRRWLARVIAPELVEAAAAMEAQEPEEPEAGRPAFAELEQTVLGLREVDRERSKKLEEVAEFMKGLDSTSRARVVAYAAPKRVGRRQILARAEAQSDAWYRDHPNS